MINVIDMDFVIIAGQRVNRPSWISRSTWMEFWEEIKRPQPRDLIT